MISFCPDVNIWLALVAEPHCHNRQAWAWLNEVTVDARLIFCRYTQLGLLRLLTTPAVMGEKVLTIREAWDVCDRLLRDPRVEFCPESPGLETIFRRVIAPFGAKSAPKWVGDCYVLAYAEASQATLVTFDRALLAFARKHDYAAIVPE